MIPRIVRMLGVNTPEKVPKVPLPTWVVIFVPTNWFISRTINDLPQLLSSNDSANRQLKRTAQPVAARSAIGKACSEHGNEPTEKGYHAPFEPTRDGQTDEVMGANYLHRSSPKDAGYWMLVGKMS